MLGGVYFLWEFFDLGPKSDFSWPIQNQTLAGQVALTIGWCYNSNHCIRYIYLVGDSMYPVLHKWRRIWLARLGCILNTCRLMCKPRTEYVLMALSSKAPSECMKARKGNMLRSQIHDWSTQDYQYIPHRTRSHTWACKSIAWSMWLT